MLFHASCERIRPNLTVCIQKQQSCAEVPPGIDLETPCARRSNSWRAPGRGWPELDDVWAKLGGVAPSSTEVKASRCQVLPTFALFGEFMFGEWWTKAESWPSSPPTWPTWPTSADRWSKGARKPASEPFVSHLSQISVRSRGQPGSRQAVPPGATWCNENHAVAIVPVRLSAECGLAQTLWPSGQARRDA